MIKEKKKIPTRFTLNLDEETAKRLVDLCGWEGRKKSQMLATLINKEHSKHKLK